MRLLTGVFVFLLVVCGLHTPSWGTDLRVFEWEGYIWPYKDKFEAYARSKGKDIHLVTTLDASGKQRFIGSADDIFVVARDGQADIVTPTNNYFKAEGGKLLRVLLPLDVSRMPNYADIPAGLRNAQYSYEGGKPHAVPFLGGSYAIAYNANRVTVAPNSWADLLDPRFAGRVSVTNDQFEANIYSLALLAGSRPQDVYDVDKIDRKKVQEYLNTLVRNCASLWGGLPNVEEMPKLDVVTDYWMAVTMANAAGQNWKLATPKEGETVWLDNISITRAVENNPEKLEAAYLLLDFMLSPEIQGSVGRDLGVVVSNPKAKPFLPAGSMLERMAGDPSFFREEYFWQPLSIRTRNAYRQMWAEALKAAGKN